MSNQVKKVILTNGTTCDNDTGFYPIEITCNVKSDSNIDYNTIGADTTSLQIASIIDTFTSYTLTLAQLKTLLTTDKRVIIVKFSNFKEVLPIMDWVITPNYSNFSITTPTFVHAYTQTVDNVNKHFITVLSIYINLSNDSIRLNKYGNIEV